jgi:protein-tyrosine-phosphatase
VEAFALKTILFVCVENAGRSQMAEAFARKHGRGLALAESAGTMPAKLVNPVVVQAMKERGIDLSENHPRIMDLKRAEQADVITTMGCSVEEYCPAQMLKKAVD